MTLQQKTSKAWPRNPAFNQLPVYPQPADPCNSNSVSQSLSPKPWRPTLDPKSRSPRQFLIPCAQQTTQLHKSLLSRSNVMYTFPQNVTVVYAALYSLAWPKQPCGQPPWVMELVRLAPRTSNKLLPIPWQILPGTPVTNRTKLFTCTQFSRAPLDMLKYTCWM